MIFRSLVSGSSGNCILFSYENTNILIDCGISGRRVAESLGELEIDPCEISAILVTHEHSDHTTGVGVLSRKYDIPVIASVGTWSEMNIGFVNEDNKIEFSKNERLHIKDIDVIPFDIPHDAAQPTGYAIECDGKRFAVATDMGFASKNVLDNLMGCEAVILEANYDEDMLRCGSYPPLLKDRIAGENGHMDNKDTGVLASMLVKNGTKRIMLGHLSNENNSPDKAFAEVARELEFNGIELGRDVLLSVAPRYEKSENLCVNI